MTWAGVDVGGRTKGFHAAVVDEVGVVAGPQRLRTVMATVEWLAELAPTIVALDSPKTCAEPGERSRASERDVVREICGIRWTPDQQSLAGNPYYEWIRCGLELYAALDGRRREMGWQVIEVFPTASWTIWAGRRGQASRARWTREALQAIALNGLPTHRLNQDDRDALAAALTAMLHGEGRTKELGDIVVPLGQYPLTPWPPPPSPGSTSCAS